MPKFFLFKMLNNWADNSFGQEVLDRQGNVKSWVSLYIDDAGIPEKDEYDLVNYFKRIDDIYAKIVSTKEKIEELNDFQVFIF
jgi:hypothetical protein